MGPCTGLSGAGTFLLGGRAASAGCGLHVMEPGSGAGRTSPGDLYTAGRSVAGFPSCSNKRKHVAAGTCVNNFHVQHKWQHSMLRTKLIRFGACTSG